MKRLCLIALATMLTVSYSIAAERTVYLDNNVIELGDINTSSDLGNESIEIVRTSETPRYVNLWYNVTYLKNKCVRTEIERIWIPGETHEICHEIPGNPHFCREYETPGRYEEVEMCVEWKKLPTSKKKLQVLDFKKANRLAGNGTETFMLHFEQTNEESSFTKITGEALSTLSSYSIKHVSNIFGKRKRLSFMAQ